MVFVSEVLAGEPVALEETGDGVWSMRFGPLFLGWVGEAGRLVPASSPPGRKGKKQKKGCENGTVAASPMS
jgi:hypothetical protein